MLGAFTRVTKAYLGLNSLKQAKYGIKQECPCKHCHFSQSTVDSQHGNSQHFLKHGIFNFSNFFQKS